MPPVLKQPSAFRDREGGFNKQNESAVISVKSNETIAQRKRGRPKGSTTKPKGLIPTELADKFLDSVKPLLPAEHYQQMKDAVKNGKSISTVTEAKIMLKLLGPSLMRRLIDEYDPNAGLDPDLAEELGRRDSEFKKDTNERLKVWMDLLKLVHQMEKQDDAASGHTKKKPLIEITARRGIDAGRIGLLIDFESRSMGGDADGTGREGITIRTVSDSIPQRQIDVQDSQQVETTRILDNVEYRDDS